MRMVFERRPRGGCVTRVDRPDGVVVELITNASKWPIPHDLAHAVTERELGLTDGVFGSIASGAMFKSMRVVAGRLRHDAAARSRRVLRANARAITVAELLTGVVHHAVLRGDRSASFSQARAGWGAVEERPFPWTEADLVRATDALRACSERWEAMGPSEHLELTWPDRLIVPAPPAPRPTRPGPRRR